MSRFSLLSDWLEWQETLHPRKIDLGLERVLAVAERLQLLHSASCVITVAGTNGKGSSVAMLESILLAAGYRVGSYTSPHLLRYNERIRLNGVEIGDALLCDAFDQVDQARANTTLSYFEFGTLAALQLFRQAPLDIVLLEVGLGGRLDAVNILDPDVALVTAISIDHSLWLGTGRESIGREKAGIFRAGRAAVCSDPHPPASLAGRAQEVGAVWFTLGSDFNYRTAVNSWTWQREGQVFEELPFPSLAGKHQLDNAAGVIMVLDILSDRFSVSRTAIEDGLTAATLPGRCQFRSGNIDCVFDVAHNPGSAERLVELLQDQPVRGRTRVVLGMLTDKEVGQFTSALQPLVDDWYLTTLECERGLSASVLQERMCPPGAGETLRCFQDTASAFLAAQADAGQDDRVVVCGSFFTVAAALTTHV